VETGVFLATLLLLSWPLVVNGAPFYSEDSPSYLRGGAFGIHTGLLMLNDWWHSLGAASSPATSAGGGSPRAIVAQAVAEAGGARSVIYSLLTYVLRSPGNSLIALAVAQAAAVALVINLLRRTFAPGLGAWGSLGLAAAIAFLTTAPWFAVYAIPDVLAGVAIAAGLVLTIVFDRLGLAARLVLVALIALCITTHGSHLPLALAVLLAGAAAHFWLLRASVIPVLRRAIWFASPIALALTAMLATSYVAFGEFSLAPKRYPIQLARSVADGPGAWYLRDHCATEHYAICEIFGSEPPRNIADFLWAKTGVRYRATPEQMERIRAEEGTIIRAAALEYPGVQLRQSASNSFFQLFRFGLDNLDFGFRIVGEEDPALVQEAPDRTLLKTIGEGVIYLAFIAAILLLLFYRRSLTSTEIAALAVTSVGLLANAAICGILSAVTDRYQGRVAWVLPTLAFILLARVWTGTRPAETSAKATLA
jgi:hypothetical protein